MLKVCACARTAESSVWEQVCNITLQKTWVTTLLQEWQKKVYMALESVGCIINR